MNVTEPCNYRGCCDSLCLLVTMSRMSTHDVDNHEGNFLGENSPAEHGDDGELT
jgi:hypothetical protein